MTIGFIPRAATLCCTVILAFAFVPRAHAADPPARELVHLLDYIAQDYAGAVENGRVISAEEFGEMREFARRASELQRDVPALAGEPLRSQLVALSSLIEQRAPLVSVRKQAMTIKSAVIRRTHLAIAPMDWPDMERGAALYQQACSACHGSSGRGDGPAAPGIEPRPTNLHDDGRMRQLSPFQAFNTVRLGVSGTAMPSFSNLSDDDTWALAFYVVSLRYRSGAVEMRRATALPLDVAASESDAELEMRARGSAADKRAIVAATRLHSKGAAAADTLAIARSLLRDAGAAYASGDVRTAREKALLAYLDGIEPAEARLRAATPGSVVLLERRMSAVRSAIEADHSPASVAAAVRDALAEIDRAETRLNRKPSRWVIFWVAAAIVVREGFEAILIIIAVLSVLRRIGATHAVRWVHAGWIAALAFGVAAWFLSDFALRSTGLQRELLEGITSLFAVVILLYLGLWLHRRAQIGRWKSFIEDQVKAALTTERLFALTSISFLAVFREAIETVLFLLALSQEGGAEGRKLMASGVAISIVFTIGLAWLLVRLSHNLPLKVLFTAMSLLMIVLAVMLGGKGLHSLQETGIVTNTATPFDLQVDWLGLYPSVQTLAAQLLIGLLAALLWWRARSTE